MSAALALADGFSWLDESCRPSPREVEHYARIIAAAESPSARPVEALRREAELQLWIWRAENHPAKPNGRQPPVRRRRCK